MAYDDIVVTAGAYDVPIPGVAVDVVAGVGTFQRTKVSFGGEGTATEVSATAGAQFPIALHGVETGSNPSLPMTALAVDADRNALIVTLGTPLSRAQASVTAHLAAGTNNIGDVDVLTVPADPFGATADAASASGSISAKLKHLAAIATPTSMARLISAASTNATSVKASAGTLHGLQVFNVNAAPRYLKLYDKASAPTVGTDTPVETLTIPGNPKGRGVIIPFPPAGAPFPTGIAFALTTGVADADTGAVAANEIVVNLDYK